MVRRTTRFIGLGGTVAAVAALLLAAGPGAQAAPQRAASSMTTLKVALTDHGMYVDGPRTFPAGLVHLTLDNAKSKGDGTLAIVALAGGHSWHDFRSGLAVAFQNLFAPHGNKKKGLKALNGVLSYASGYGGLDTGPGEVHEGTLLLSTPDTQYFLYDDSGNLPNRPKLLTTTAAAGSQTLPTTSATVVAQTNRRFGGANVLPHNGTITFENKSTESPHFLELQQVKDGTTRKQVIAGLQSNGPGPFLRHSQGTDVVSYGHAMNMHVHLPAGTYAEMCFFPDPQTGMPHAFMGMVRIVHLK
jgi:hypothetical protein